MKVHPLQKPDLFDIHAITQKLKAETEKEHLYLIKNGKAFAWFDVDKDNVNPPVEQIFRFNDALVLHNHPDGTSFSFEDVRNIIQTNIKEMRLIT